MTRHRTNQVNYSVGPLRRYRRLSFETPTFPRAEGSVHSFDSESLLCSKRVTRFRYHNLDRDGPRSRTQIRGRGYAGRYFGPGLSKPQTNVETVRPDRKGPVLHSSPRQPQE